MDMDIGEREGIPASLGRSRGPRLNREGRGAHGQRNIQRNCLRPTSYRGAFPK